MLLFPAIRSWILRKSLKRQHQAAMRIQRAYRAFVLHRNTSLPVNQPSETGTHDTLNAVIGDQAPKKKKVPPPTKPKPKRMTGGSRRQAQAGEKCCD